MDEKNTVLVCVTPQKSSKRLVEAGKILASKNEASLDIVSVLPVDFNNSSKEPAALEQIFDFSKQAGGEMAVYFSDDPALTVAAHISKTKPILLVTGFPGENSNSFISLIHLLVPELPISMVGQDDKIYNMLPFESDFVSARNSD